MTYGKRPPLDEEKALYLATIAAEGVTTSAGEGTGLSIIDSALIGAGVNSFVSMLVVIHPGESSVDSKDATAFNNATGEVTVASVFKGGQVAAGVPYKIVTFRFVPADTDPRVMGRSQMAATTIDLNQVAGTYDLFTGTTQVVILESLNIKLPTGAPGGTLASISIQTDDDTPGVIISVAEGDIANLTTEADLGWTGTLYITVGTKIQITYVGAAGAAYVCNVTAKCRAVVAGGYLA